MNALEAIGDRYGVYGFSGFGRENVEFYVIKEVDEQLTDRVKRRLDKVAPLHATRMGPAIRHATTKLSKIDAKTISKDKKIKNGVDKFILSVSENGYGKRSSYLDYRVTNRGGKGIIGIINSPRNGNISSTLVVNDNDEIILSTDKGSIMRCAVKEIRVAGRNTQGVRIKSLKGTEKVVSVIKIEDNIK